MRLYTSKAAFFDTKKADGFIKILKIAALEVLISGNLSVCLNIIYCFHGFYGKDSVESAGFFYCPFGFAKFAKRFFPSDLIRPLSQRIDPADDPRSVTNPIPTSTLQEKSFSYPRFVVPLASGQSHWLPTGLMGLSGRERDATAKTATLCRVAVKSGRLSAKLFTSCSFFFRQIYVTNGSGSGNANGVNHHTICTSNGQGVISVR